MAGTGLANFREQYPQYSDLEDEELSELVRQKWYADMDPDQYRDAMGLEPPPAPPSEPTIWDRVKGAFSSEEEKPGAILSDNPKLSEEFDPIVGGKFSGFETEPEAPAEPSALLRDQFFAGYDEWRANRQTVTALDAIAAHQSAEDIARGAPAPNEPGQFGGLSRFARNLRAQAGDPKAEAQIQAQIKKVHDKQTGILQAAIDKRAALMERTKTVPYSQASQEMLQAEGFGETLSELGDDPMQIMAEISLRSLPNMLDAIPLMVAGAAVGGPLGFAAGVGIGSSMAEYRASLADSLQQQGVDLTSAESLIAAANDPAIMAKAHNYAKTRAGVIGVASTISGGLASKPLTPFIKNVIGRELGNVAAQTVAQAGIEGTGEAAAQLATTGDIRAGEVVAESIGGAITAPIDVGTATVTGVRAQRVQAEIARIESEVNEMLGEDVPRGTPPRQPDDPVEVPANTPPAESGSGVVLETDTDEHGNKTSRLKLIEPKPALSRDEFDSDEQFTVYEELRAEVAAEIENGRRLLAEAANVSEQTPGMELEEAPANLDDGPLTEIPSGKPGTSIEENLTGGRNVRVVIRDDDGAAIGSLAFPTNADGTVNVESKEGALVFVSEQHRRKGVASALYEAAATAGYDIDAITGRRDLTRDGQAFTDQRLQSRAAREQLLADAQELGTDVPARRAQRAVERAVTGKSLTPAQQRVVSAMLERDAPQAETEQVLDSRQPDRRKTDRRQQVRRMSTDELVDAVYTDKLTGIANDRAFADDLPHHAWVAEIDADSLKFINDNISEDAGDAMLIAIAEALEQSDIDAYRVGGDEFWLGGDSQEGVRAAAELAKSILAGQTVTDPKGQVQGINITYGLGQSKEIASATMKEHKARRQTEGKRAPRGIAPEGATVNRVLSAKTVDMAPGTNYVSMIGHRGALPINANNEMVLGNGRTVRIPKMPVRREHILAVMQKAFGARIYQGRVKGKTRLGFYRPGHGEIRIKNANDIEVAAHEVAHWLDDRHPWIAELYKKYNDEVKSVSYDVTKITEGWAEFMRLFMTQEYMVIKSAPAFYDAFRSELTKHPKLEAMIYDLQELMHAWTQQGARARLASKHGATEASVIEKIANYFRVPFLQSALDGLRRVKEIGLEVAGVDTAYRKLRLALGGANGMLEAAMYYGTPIQREDGQGFEFSGESLKDIFGEYWGDNDVALYMMARRGRELAGQGRENLLRPDEMVAGLKIADEIPGLPEMFERFQAFNQRMLNFAEGAGILGAETRAAIEEMNKSYVPFHRVIESEIDNRNVRTGGNPFQRLKGGTQNVANIWDNIVNNQGMMIRMALVNDGKRSLLKALAFSGKDRTASLDPTRPKGQFGTSQQNQAAGKYASPIATREAPINIQSSQVVRKVVEAMGLSWEQYLWAKEGMVSEDLDQARLEQSVVESIDAMKAGLGELMQFWQTGLDPVGQVDYYLENGKKVWFEIADAGLYDSLQYLQPKGTNLVLQILGGFSSTLRRGVVSLPVFQAKNFIRDTTNAWLLSDHIKAPAARALKAVFSRIDRDPAYREMFLNGGGFANRSQGLQAQRKIIINPTKLAATYDRFMGRFENANRLAEYKAARDAGISPQRAALLSREISTDFAMRGSSEIARYIAIAVPFLNARMQGNYRVARQFDTADHALSYATRGAALMTATLALYALNKDDDRYKELPEDIKDLNWVVYTGSGEDDYFLIPKPFESGMLWGTIPERMVEYTEERDGKEFADALGWMFLQTFSMDMVPQMFQPEVDIQNNKSFTGAPVVPFYLENVEPSQQFTWYTSETARQAGKMFGISPIKLEHRIRGYLGTMGAYALGASDAIIRAATDPDDLAFGEAPTRGDSWKENIMVRALIDPLVGEGPPRRTKYVTDLYDMIREAQLVANTTDLMIRRQNAEVEQYLNDPEKQVQVLANPILQTARSGLNDIRRQGDLIRMSKDLSGDEKRAQLWELTRAKNKLARDVVLETQREQDRIESELANRPSQANAQ